MNLVLLFVLIAEVCVGICAWLSPEYLRRMAAHLLTRADMIELLRREEERRMRYWTMELAAEERPEAEAIEGLERGRVFARR